MIVKLLYGSGLRIFEAVRLRVHDIDPQLKQITVRSGKGGKDHVTTFPASVVPLLENHLWEGTNTARVGSFTGLR